MKHNPVQPMTDEEYEALLDNIEKILGASIDALDVAQALFHADTSTVYPEESIAAAQCRDDLMEVVESIRRRRISEELYRPSVRIAELVDQFQSE